MGIIIKPEHVDLERNSKHTEADSSFFYFHQIDSVKIRCTIDLDAFYTENPDREKFEKKWKPFLDSDPCNERIFITIHRLCLDYAFSLPCRVLLSVPGAALLV